MALTKELRHGVAVVTTDNDGVPVVDLAGDGGDIVALNAERLSHLYAPTQVLPFAAPVTAWDIGVRGKARLTLTDGTTLTASNLADGQVGVLIIKQDSMGGHVLDFDNVFRSTRGALPQIGTEPGDVSILSVLVDEGVVYVVDHQSGGSEGEALSLLASAGSFVLSGQEAGLRWDRVLVAEAGSFVLSGQSADLRYASGETLDAEAGEFVVSGQAAGLRWDRVLVAEAGSFVLSGQDAELTVGGEGGDAFTATDFAGYTNDETPADWTKRWTTQDWLKQSAGYVRANIGSNARSGLSWDEAGSQGDIEILAKLRTTNSGSNTAQMGVFCRGAGATGSETLYGLVLIRDSSGTNGIRCSRYSGGSVSTLQESVESGLWSTAWQWVRLRVIGDSVKAKIWPDGDEEPASWRIDVTDASPLSAGFAGLWGFRSGAHDWDWFGFSTDGSTVPEPE